MFKKFNWFDNTFKTIFNSFHNISSPYENMIPNSQFYVMGTRIDNSYMLEPSFSCNPLVGWNTDYLGTNSKVIAGDVNSGIYEDIGRTSFCEITGPVRLTRFNYDRLDGSSKMSLGVPSVFSFYMNYKTVGDVKVNGESLKTLVPNKWSRVKFKPVYGDNTPVIDIPEGCTVKITNMMLIWGTKHKKFTTMRKDIHRHICAMYLTEYSTGDMNYNITGLPTTDTLHSSPNFVTTYSHVYEGAINNGRVSDIMFYSTDDTQIPLEVSSVVKHDVTGLYLKDLPVVNGNANFVLPDNLRIMMGVKDDKH